MTVEAGPQPPADIALVIYQKDGFAQPFRFKDGDGDLIDLTGYDFVASFDDRNGKVTPPDLAVGDGIEITDDGEITMTIETDDLDFHTTRWQLDVTPAGDTDPQRWVAGKVYLRKAVI